MIRLLFSTILVLATATGAMGHFLFVLPEVGGAKARVVFSEDLKPDADVDVAIAAGATLVLRDLATGRDAPLALAKSGDALSTDLPGTGTRVVHGLADLGVKQRKDGKPHRLTYHPKTIVGDAFDPKATLGQAATPVEIAPVGKVGELKFRVLIQGKPAAGVEVNVILPDGKQRKAVTDRDGLTAAFDGPGRYGAWARYFEPAAGEQGGKRYEEVRHYATLVADVPAAAAPAAASVDQGAAGAPVAKFATLPEATSSFGAVALDGWLYVYGGHVARTHTYHTTAVSGRFHRLNLADGKTWEDLPGGPALQGMNLAAHDGKIYRAGGMRCLNKQGEKADNHSTADVARFDPATKTWTALPPLPEPRSSHDVAILDGKLIVVGGWNMRGKAGNDWLGTMLSLDLSAKDPAWQAIKQPFERRALIAAVHAGKLYVLGGFDDESDPSLRVEIYDPKAAKWTTGPSLPGKPLNGFAPAACAHEGALYVSVGDGTLYRLDEAGQSWGKVASTTPRIVHRLAPAGPRILVIGGAHKADTFDLVEAVTPAPVAAGAAAR